MYSFVRDSRERRVEKKGVVFCLHWGLPLKIFCKVEISKYTSQFEVIPKLWKQEFKYVSVQIKMPQVILTNIVNVLWSFWKLFYLCSFLRSALQQMILFKITKGIWMVKYGFWAHTNTKALNTIMISLKYLVAFLLIRASTFLSFFSWWHFNVMGPWEKNTLK